jgi:hypothetical protein
LFGAKHDGTNQVYGASSRGAFKIVGLHDSDTSPQYLAIYGANQGTVGNTISWNTVGFAQDEDGNVGIGTTSPSYKLSVHHDTTNVVGSFTSGDNQVWINLNDDGGGTYGCLIGHDSDAGDLFTIADNGVNKRIRVTENGNVCIGSTSPAFTAGSGLEIERGGTTTLRLQNTAAAKTVEFNMGTDLEIKCLNTGSDIILTPTANVGIGTTPTVKLDIANSEAADVTLRSRAYGVGQGVHGAALLLGKIESSTDQPMGAVRGRPSAEDSSSFGDLIFESRGSGSLTERMRIKGTGNVGIGTDNPSSILHLYANDPQILLDDSGTQSSITGQSGNILYKTSSTNRDHVFFGVNNEKFRITGDGILQVGSLQTTILDASRNLQNIAQFSSTGVHLVGITSGVGVGATPADANSAELGPGFLNLARDDTADAKQILFGKNGAVHSYIKTTLTNNGLVIGCSTSDVLNVNSVGIIVTGSITATGDVTAFQSSDERLKTNLVKIDSALNKVSQISGYHFEWKKRCRSYCSRD